MNGHKNLNDSHNYNDANHEEIELYKELETGAIHDTQNQNNAHSKNSFADQCTIGVL